MGRSQSRSKSKKHGVSFKEAQLVFFDEFGVEDYDAANSDELESRFSRVGMSIEKILMVVFIVRDEQTETYRIISARRAGKQLEKVYWNERQRNER